jgi:hypothetical protein
MNVCFSWRRRKDRKVLTPRSPFQMCQSFNFLLFVWERNAKTDGLQMTKSLTVRSPLLLMWCSEGGRTVRLCLTPEEEQWCCLKIDTSCHIEFLHLSTRMFCKGAAPNSHISSRLQNSKCHYVRRLRYFNQMIIKNINWCQHDSLLSMSRLSWMRWWFQ